MKVKSLKKFTVRHKKLAFGGEPDEEIFASQVNYDEQGNVVEQLKIDDDEGINERNIYSYNDSGKLICHEVHLDMEGFYERFDFTRDENNRLTCEQKYYGDDPGERIVFYYDSHDHPVKIEKFDADGEQEQVELFKYDDKHNLVENHKFDNSGNLLEKSTIEFNEKNLPVAKYVYDSNGDLVKGTTLEYNEQGEPTTIDEKNASGKLISRVHSVYNEKGLVIERHIKDFHSRVMKFVYDEQNNCIEESLYDEHGNLTMKLTYEYDDENRLVFDSAYYLDASGGGSRVNSMNRYEYEFW